MRHAGDQASGSGKMKRKLYEKDLHKFQRERQLTSSSTTFLTRLRRCFTMLIRGRTGYPKTSTIGDRQVYQTLLLAKET